MEKAAADIIANALPVGADGETLLPDQDFGVCIHSLGNDKMDYLYMLVSFANPSGVVLDEDYDYDNELDLHGTYWTSMDFDDGTGIQDFFDPCDYPLTEAMMYMNLEDGAHDPDNDNTNYLHFKDPAKRTKDELMGFIRRFLNHVDGDISWEGSEASFVQFNDATGWRHLNLADGRVGRLPSSGGLPVFDSSLSDFIVYD